MWEYILTKTFITNVLAEFTKYSMAKITGNEAFWKKSPEITHFGKKIARSDHKENHVRTDSVISVPGIILASSLFPQVKSTVIWPKLELPCLELVALVRSICPALWPTLTSTSDGWSTWRKFGSRPMNCARSMASIMPALLWQTSARKSLMIQSKSPLCFISPKQWPWTIS